MTQKKIACKFSKEFKEEAVKLITERGYRYQEAAELLNTTSKNINRWVLDYKRGSNFTPSPAVPTEIEILQKRIKTLELEKEILKKAAAFFAKELH